MNSFSTKLINWHRENGRKNLPWQIKKTPYKVWISEIMLQQTQVKTVIPYFKKFVRIFPNISNLADSNLDEVLALWSGLGYYARARNLHKTSLILKKEFNSNLPNTLEELIKLPGIGRSTAGAILSLGFNKRAPILDGNVKRVIARYTNIREDLDNTKTLKYLWDISEELLPSEGFAIYNQSVMDLGSMVCKKTNPLCHLCPVSRSCLGKMNKTIQSIPKRKKKKNKLSKRVIWLLPYTESSHIYLEKRPTKGIWGGLWTFLEDKNLKTILRDNKNLKMIEDSLIRHSSIKHSFTHYNLEAELYLIKSKGTDNINHWKRIDDFNKIGVPKPILSVLKKIQRNGKISFL
ncbi:MAG: A/G-specific adenine glycosylase [Candidatus Marinimicrobia bacterium]|nr:A/G-specific adenine glycosylase [Candidatus Neomarinimicrobiota bacterium]|tara:strand:+ start:2191 stop:3234 length:1044 start_codon:yes stop_codon:yes gene_type:complete